MELFYHVSRDIELPRKGRRIAFQPGPRACEACGGVGLSDRVSQDLLVADDNDPEMNHPTTTNCLWGDGAVRAFELVELQEDGTISPEEEILLVGPDSPVEDLRKLSLD